MLKCNLHVNKCAVQCMMDIIVYFWHVHGGRAVVHLSTVHVQCIVE